jgi:mannitol-specific phosphotransferase system IIBC component
MFQGDLHENITNTTTFPTVSVNSTTASQQSRSGFDRGALVGLVVGCVTAMLLSAIIVTYMIKRTRRNKKSRIVTSPASAATSQDAKELSTERPPREIMSEPSELFTEPLVVELGNA